ncbi:MAG: TIGR01777 family oxidoreductase [Bacteroidota bacterium]
MANVLIGGGTGLVGTHLSRLLKAKNYTVTHLSRTRNLEAEFPAYRWDIEKGEIDKEAVQNADYIINLAGAGIADKLWTESRKQLIISSRVNSTLLLRDAIQQHRPDLSAFLSASAMGYYGNRGEEKLTEDSGAGGDQFLVTSVQAWENAIEQVAKTDVRTAWLRIGLVLSTQGGALPKMTMSTKVSVGGYFGDGQQWYAWIHIEDLCRAFIYLIQNEQLEGAFNAVAPYAERNKAFTEKIGTAMDKNLALIPAPAFALKLGMGEMSTTVLNSAHVVPERLLENGFDFQFERLVPALRNLFNRDI